MVSVKDRRELEYVRLVGYDDTISDLKDISGNIGDCADNMPAVKDLEHRKYDEVEKAKHAAREVLQVAKKLDVLLLKKKFGSLIYKRTEPAVYVRTGDVMSDREAIDVGKENLKNLKKNLEEMESHFKEL